MSDDESSTESPAILVPPFSEAPVGASLGAVAALLSSVGILWIGALMALIVADVLGRNFLDAPITGVAEIAARSVVAIVFLQVAAAILQRRLTRADFLVRRLRSASGRAVALLEAAFALSGALVFALVLWASWPSMVDAWRNSEFFGVQGVFTIPTFPFRAITVLGSGVAVLAALYRVAAELRAAGGHAE